MNLRRRFRLPEREIELTDQMVIARTSKRLLALVADAVHGVIECAEGDVVGMQHSVPGVEYVEGIAKTQDGLVLIHDLEKFLALEEETALQEAMNNA
jgi:purine-binding chemotaxis protein CheW